MAGADEALRIVYELGQILRSPEGSRIMVSQLVGMSLEARVLQALPSDARPSFLRGSVAQHQTELSNFRESVRNAYSEQAFNIMLGQRTAALLPGYLKRYRSEGEYEAMSWLKQQIGPESE